MLISEAVSGLKARHIQLLYAQMINPGHLKKRGKLLSYSSCQLLCRGCCDFMLLACCGVGTLKFSVLLQSISLVHCSLAPYSLTGAGFYTFAL